MSDSAVVLECKRTSASTVEPLTKFFFSSTDSPISNPQTGHNAAEFPLNLSDIERIEVLEGAASRVFGTQAFSGAVNIVTRRDARTALSLAGGSYGTAQAEARTGLQARRGNVDFTSSLSLGYGRSDGAVRNSDFRYGKAFWQGRADAPDFRVDALFGWTQSDFGANTFYSTKSANQWEGTHRLLAGVRAETKGRLHLAPQVSWLRNADHFQFVRNTPTYENFNRGDVFTLGLNAWTDWAPAAPLSVQRCAKNSFTPAIWDATSTRLIGLPSAENTLIAAMTKACGATTTAALPTTPSAPSERM